MQRRGYGSVLVPALLCLAGCDAAAEPGAEARELTTLSAALDADGRPAEVLARQQDLLEVLAERRSEELPDHLDLSFRFVDYEQPKPAGQAVGATYLPSWRERPGLNYYQFLAMEIPDDVEWAGRTLEMIWGFETIALVAAHRDESDPIFTEWRLRNGTWKAARMTIHLPEEVLQDARRSRRRR